MTGSNLGTPQGIAMFGTAQQKAGDRLRVIFRGKRGVQLFDQTGDAQGLLKCGTVFVMPVAQMCLSGSCYGTVALTIER